MSDNEQIKLLIVDDQDLMRDGLVSLLEVHSFLDIVGASSNGQDAIQLAEKLLPDVILMDVRMPLMDGIQATEKILQNHHDCKILMLTTFNEDDLIIRAMLAGAVGYLLKSMPTGELAQAIRAAYRGIYLLDATVGAVIVGNLKQLSSRKTPDTLEIELTERQIEVLQLVAQGASNKEIAHKLHISEGTVKNYISTILSELGLRDRTQAAIYAYEHGLI